MTKFFGLDTPAGQAALEREIEILKSEIQRRRYNTMLWKEIKELLAGIAIVCIGIAAVWSTIAILLMVWG